jgi:hypothetical protein
LDLGIGSGVLAIRWGGGMMAYFPSNCIAATCSKKAVNDLTDVCIKYNCTNVSNLNKFINYSSDCHTKCFTEKSASFLGSVYFHFL